MTKHKLLVFAIGAVTAIHPLPSLAADNTSKIVKELQPAVAPLQKAECPAYLPTWIPQNNKSKFSQTLINNDSSLRHGYEVSLGTEEQLATCNTTFYLLGGEGRAKGKHPVVLSGGRTGFLKNALIEWNQGKYRYSIGFINKKTSNADMTKCANSMVQVPSLKSK